MTEPTDEEIQKANEEYEDENKDRLRIHTTQERLRIGIKRDNSEVKKWQLKWIDLNKLGKYP